ALRLPDEKCPANRHAGTLGTDQRGFELEEDGQRLARHGGEYSGQQRGFAEASCGKVEGTAPSLLELERPESRSGGKRGRLLLRGPLHFLQELLERGRI